VIRKGRGKHFLRVERSKGSIKIHQRTVKLRRQRERVGYMNDIRCKEKKDDSSNLLYPTYVLYLIITY
jgi:hypothetical protein